MAGNQFNVGVAQANVNPLIRGIGGMLEKNRAEEKSKADANALNAAFESGDPDAVAKMIASNPDIAGRLSAMNQHKDETTKKGYEQSIRSLLATKDPAEREQILTNQINLINERGGNPVQSVMALNELKTDPERFEKSLSLVASGVLKPQEYKELSAQNAPVDNFKQQALDIKRSTLELRRDEAALRKNQIGVNSEANDLKRQELQLKIDTNKEKLANAKIKSRSEMGNKIKQSKNLISSIDSFIKNKDYMASVTGRRGQMPSLTTTGIEADAYLDNIKNNLTLENLDKMTGVLSETDIKILASAGTSLRQGMSKEAMITEFNKIKDLASGKSEEVQRQLQQLVGGGAQDQDQEKDIPELSPAEEWLKNNPNDPRAAAVRAKAGIPEPKKELSGVEKWLQENPNDPRAAAIRAKAGL